MMFFSPVEALPQHAPDAARAPVSGRRPVRGRLALEFAADGEARTYLARQYAAYPFHVCRVQYLDPDIPGLATLYAQSCSGGLYEDDALELAVAVRPQAEAHFTTQASTIVHSMASGAARQDMHIEAEAGSYLEYLPDPQILFPRSSCSSTIKVAVARGAVVLVSDSFLMHDPAGNDAMFSAYGSEVIVEDADGKRLAVDRLRLDERSLAARTPGVAGSFRAQGTLAVVMLDGATETTLAGLRAIEFPDDEAAIGVSRLPRSAGLIVRILAHDGAALKRAMRACWSAARLALRGTVPVPRRK